MVVVGADVHKRSHTFVAADEQGRQVAVLTVRADSKGHDKAVRWAQVAPIPVWSGATRGRVRLNRAGNRQLNAALHRIALTQIQRQGAGRASFDKRLAHGDSTAEALRCLKRRLAGVVDSSLKNHPSGTAATGVAAAA